MNIKLHLFQLVSVFSDFNFNIHQLVATQFIRATPKLHYPNRLSALQSLKPKKYPQRLGDSSEWVLVCLGFKPDSARPTSNPWQWEL